MKHLTYTVGAGGNFIACLLCHSKYNKPIEMTANNEFGCEKLFKHAEISHTVTENPTILIHEPNKDFLYKKQTILLRKRITAYKNIYSDARLSVKSLLHDGNFEFQIDRQQSITDFRHIYEWNELFYSINRWQWEELFHFFKCEFKDEYMNMIETYRRKNEEIYNHSDNERLHDFLQKYA